MRAITAILFCFAFSIAKGQYNTSAQFENAKLLLENGDTLAAQRILLNCVDIYKEADSITYEETRACEMLHKIYYSQSKYREALNYLDYPSNKHKKYRRMCQGGRGHIYNLYFCYKKALCYNYLKKSDSVISSLIGPLFTLGDISTFDSIEVDRISRFFVGTLFSVYGKCEIRQQLEDAIAKMRYKQIIKNEQRHQILDIDYSFYLLNYKINLNSSLTYFFSSEELIPPDLYKEELMSELKRNPVYKLIMK